MLAAIGSMFIGAAPSPGVTGNIQWLTFEQAIAKQKVEPKKLFIDVYTDWCGWCKRMDASTFSDPEIGAYMNKYFYAVKLDAEMMDTVLYNNYTFTNGYFTDKNGKQRKGTHQLATSLLDSKMSYPSYAILDERNARLSIHKGYMRNDQLAGVLLFYGTDQYKHYEDYLLDQFERQNKTAKPQAQ